MNRSETQVGGIFAFQCSGVSLIKLFSLSLTLRTRTNKLECLHLVWVILMLVSKARKCCFHRNRNEQSRLFVRRDEEKKSFFNIDTIEAENFLRILREQQQILQQLLQQQRQQQQQQEREEKPRYQHQQQQQQEQQQPQQPQKYQNIPDPVDFSTDSIEL